MQLTEVGGEEGSVEFADPGGPLTPNAAVMLLQAQLRRLSKMHKAGRVSDNVAISEFIGQFRDRHVADGDYTEDEMLQWAKIDVMDAMLAVRRRVPKAFASSPMWRSLELSLSAGLDVDRIHQDLIDMLAHQATLPE